jgi:ribosomal protein S18 acetylase RimI-like enzyme
MVLRSASTEDSEELANLEFGLFPENNLNERTLEGVLLHRASWVVSVDRIIVGYLLGQPDPGGLLDVLRLGVAPQFQRRKLGSRLLERALRDYPDTMLTVQKDNLGALKLYSQHGLRIVGEIPSANSWVMRVTSYASS